MKVEVLAYTPNPVDVIAKAANRCYNGGLEIPDVKNPARLVKAVVSSGHTSVLEHAQVTFHISEISRVCSHQLVRHRHAVYSQQSQRYCKITDGYVTPDSILENTALNNEYTSLMKQCAAFYNKCLNSGIKEEDARYIIPHSSYTAIVTTMNFRELYENFFPLRMCTRAQWEIRELAQKMYSKCMEIAPGIFEGTGPSCEKLGYCPEKHGCGMYKTFDELIGGKQ